MLNISSQESIRSLKLSKNIKTLEKVEAKQSTQVIIRLSMAFFAILLIVMFIPWTQNIQSSGLVTTLKPDQRPQSIPSIIAGRIEKWYVQEGDYVSKGDTILHISEIKDEYFDPELLARTKNQRDAKQGSVGAYAEKVSALDKQIAALQATSNFKLSQSKIYIQQSELKVIADSIDLEAAKTNKEIAQLQYDRMETLYEKGLKSKTDLENRRLKLQEAQAKLISAESKLLSSRQEVERARVEISSIENQYLDQISKAQSEKYTALSSMYNAEADLTKLENQYSNYEVRTNMYYIKAPQSGYVSRTTKSGIGQTVKEGDEIVSIMPLRYDLAVEMFVDPIDLPLMYEGLHVRVQFDGWPAIVFSGWPNASYGTFGGTVYAIDQFISPNGKYRVLVAPDETDHKWPDAIRVGAGTKNMVLLDDVPIWYELWRQVNGFPPNFYTPAQTTTTK